MNKLKYIIFALLASCLFLTSCELEERMYEGEPFLSFLTESQNVFIDQDSGGKEVAIEVGTAQRAPGTVVTLGVDPDSPAKEGTDFVITKKEVTLNGDDVVAKFMVKFLESAATTNAKKAVFTVSSPTVKNGIEKQKHTVTFSLRCPVTAFTGAFGATTDLFGGPFNVEIVEGDKPNTLIIEDYIEEGYDLVLKYDAEGRVTFDPQETGYMHPTYGMIKIKMATDNSVSSVNFCLRTMNLRVNYFVAAGTFGDETNTFVGK